jgi:hypothetical protein
MSGLTRFVFHFQNWPLFICGRRMQSSLQALAIASQMRVAAQGYSASWLVKQGARPQAALLLPDSPAAHSWTACYVMLIRHLPVFVVRSSVD